MRNLRRWNAPLSAAILVLFLLHAIAGGYQMMGLMEGGSTVMKVLGWLMGGLVALHAVIGLLLTADTLKTCRKAGKSYFRENIGFWIRRLSGLAILLLVWEHLLVFVNTGAVFRLGFFGGPQLAASILLVLSLAVHLLANLKPLAISLGCDTARKILPDILFVLAVVMVFCAAAFVVYYLRWEVLWRQGI